MVADKVTVISKKYGSDEAWKWESEGADGYTMTPCERAAAGTDVIMQLKADTDDEKYSRFLKTWELQSLVRKYSDYIRFPIKMLMPHPQVKEGVIEGRRHRRVIGPGQVAHVSEHEKLTGPGVENVLRNDPAVGACNDKRMRSLS